MMADKKFSPNYKRRGYHAHLYEYLFKIRIKNNTIKYAHMQAVAIVYKHKIVLYQRVIGRTIPRIINVITRQPREIEIRLKTLAVTASPQAESMLPAAKLSFD